MKSFISIWIAPRFRTFLISLLFLIIAKNSFGCGPDFSYYYFSYLLEPYKATDKFYNYQFDLNNKFYSYYNDYYFEQPEDTLSLKEKTNIETWRNYLSLPQTIKDKAIKEFIYNNSTSNLNRLLETRKPKDEIETILLEKKSETLLAYFTLLNEYKETMAIEKDDWNYATYTSITNENNVKAFNKKCENILSKTNDVFLQWRYLYLMLRTAHFNKFSQMASDIFDKYYPKLKKENYIAQYWCENIKAGASLKMNNDAECIYYSARAFANTPDQHFEAMQNYLFSNRNWQAALKYCKKSEDSIYVILLEGSNNPFPNLEHISNVAKINPNNEALKLLWLRETKKIEEFDLNKYSTPYIYNVYKSDTSYDVNIDEIIKSKNIIGNYFSIGNSIIDNKNIKANKTTIANCMAYILMRNNKNKEAKTILDKVANEQKDEIEKQQYQLLTSLLELKLNNKFNEDNLIKMLAQLKRKTENEYSFNTVAQHYLLHNEIAPFYLQQKDTVTAFWAYVYTNCLDAGEFDLYTGDYSPESWNNINYSTYLLLHIFNEDKIDLLKRQYIYSKGANQMQTFFIQNSKLKNKEKLFNEVLAKKYMLAEDWEKAIALLKNTPEEYRNQMGLNPANFRINDYIQNTEEQDAKSTFTVNDILELAKKLKPNADNDSMQYAKDRLLYATILYNLSFYGKNHYILDNHWNHYGTRLSAYYKFDSVSAALHLNGEDYNNQPMAKPYKNYFYLYNAEKYLQNALSGLTNIEDRAVCEFMLAKCWQKRCPLKYKKGDYGYIDVESDYYANSLKNPYFKNYGMLYQSTKTYQEVFTTCTYYKQFLVKK